MNPTVIAQLAGAAVFIRNHLQAAIDDDAHMITVPAQPAKPATATTPAVPAVPETVKATGQLTTAAGAAHNLACQLLNHLEHTAEAAVVNKVRAAVLQTKIEEVPETPLTVEQIADGFNTAMIAAATALQEAKAQGKPAGNSQ